MKFIFRNKEFPFISAYFHTHRNYQLFLFEKIVWAFENFLYTFQEGILKISLPSFLKKVF